MIVVLERFGGRIPVVAGRVAYLAVGVVIGAVLALTFLVS